MKKNTIKAFTLVEMLIVIVIIGILIAALMPRMQSAQGRARDVSRKNALSQIQTAIITSQQDKGNWPGMDLTPAATQGITIDQISGALITAGMSSVPSDPLESNEVTGLGNVTGTGQFIYMVTKRNGTDDGGFVLMAKTEVEGGSNWIVCSTTGSFSVGQDIRDTQTCTTFTKDEAAACAITNGHCTYQNDGQLRYILLY